MATSTKLMVMAAKPICRRPSRAACLGFFFIFRWRSMFSITTTESSTRMPMVRVKASRVSTLRLNPRVHITKKVDMSEVGMASSTIKVLRIVCRKASITRPVTRMARIRSS